MLKKQTNQITLNKILNRINISSKFHNRQLGNILARPQYIKHPINYICPSTFQFLPGGQCIDEVNSYQCECEPGFTGANCQHQLYPCHSNPCLNQATCNNQDNGGYSCHCPFGFTGDRCDVSMVYCLRLEV